MVKLRKAICWRRLERPYTRYSKYQKENFVRGRPVVKIAQFTMGQVRDDYDFSLHLLSKSDIQIRDNSIESARQTSNKAIEKVAGKSGYFLVTRMFPHHVLRENPLAAGAGADRMSTGMARSFGKPVGRAAQIKVGQIMFTIQVKKQHLDTARLALKRASYKLPCSTTIVQEPFRVGKMTKY